MCKLLPATLVAFTLSSHNIIRNNSNHNHHYCHALSRPPPSHHPTTRREFTSISSATGTLFATGILANPSSATAAAAAPLSPLLQANNSPPLRIEELGSGYDLLSPPSPLALASSDVFYPSSMMDTEWRVQRVVTSVEGDVGQAAIAWKCLGGGDGGGDGDAFASKLTQVYNVKFIPAPATSTKDAQYEYEGKLLRASILDRGDEIRNRVGILRDGGDGGATDGAGVMLSWDPQVSPNLLTYARNNGKNASPIELKVVQRKIEPPSELGFGSNELYRIQSSVMGGSTNNNVYRCARVKRRFRRGFDEATGKRIIDGIEIVTTYRVLDGVAGIEMPTSTCKSRIRMTQL